MSYTVCMQRTKQLDCLWETNVWENRMGNQEWTIRRHW